MRWIQLVGCKSHLSKILKNIGKQQDIALQVDVMVVSKGLAVEGPPDIFCVLLVLVANAFLVKLAVELLLWWQLRFLQLCRSINVVVRIDTLSKKKPLLLWTIDELVQKLELILCQSVHETLKRCIHKLQTVDEPQPTQSKIDVTLTVAGNAGEFCFLYLLIPLIRWCPSQPQRL